MKPLFPKIVLKRLPPRLKTQIIALPDVFDNRFCEVVAVHDGKLQPDGTRTHLSELSPGDHVLVVNLDAIEQMKFKKDGETFETVIEHVCQVLVEPELLEENRIE
jgi:co-chaperonin GroES (HSP10)